MPEAAAQVGVAEEQEQVLEVLDPSLHQVGEGGLYLCCRHRAGGHQVLIPLLMPRTGDEGDAPGATEAYQGIETFGHCPLPAQQPQHYHLGLAYALQQLIPSLRGAQGRGVVSAHPREALGQTGQRPVRGEDVGIGGGDEDDGLSACRSSGLQLLGILPASPGFPPGEGKA